MSLSKRQEAYLTKIVDLVGKVRAEAEKAARASKLKKRPRRTSAEAQKLRKSILAELGRGVSAAALAEKHGVSLPYIYMMKR